MKEPKADPLDSTAVPLPSRRRMLWESHGDTVRQNQVLLVSNVVLGVALCVCLAIILRIYTRPMPVLSDDRGYVLYHTTETYRLTPSRVRAYLDSTLVKLLSVNPSFYDLTPLEGMVAPNVIATFSADSASKSGLRLETDLRQIYEIYEIRLYKNPSYPKLINLLVLGERTVYQRQTDQAGNVITTPQSAKMFWSVFVDQVTPSPENPWGLMFLGAQPMTQQQGDIYWNQATPLEMEGKK